MKGNFLLLIELRSKYDPVLREILHLINLEQSTQSVSEKILKAISLPPLKISLSYFWVELLRKRFLQILKRQSILISSLAARPDIRTDCTSASTFT
ncbi:hypothetical protein CDAR_513121 [Caerostris darwini]|uniref:Uncharacterized protein n=1 Tax=Caerostris darwini TaxID=1538125 RepID=A0AAV4W2K3_9ARAC|nr:hypothetical protein CDAR_513121 [Caerostris darwini]